MVQSRMTPDTEGLAYPTRILEGCESGLLLFASGRGGQTDGWAFSDLSPVVAVDWDHGTLERLKKAAPSHWDFILEDAFEFAQTYGSQFDVVSVDAPSHFAPTLIEHIPLWLSIAGKAATITVYRHCFAGQPSLQAPELEAPNGWRFTDLIKRSEFRGGIYWLVAERA